MQAYGPLTPLFEVEVENVIDSTVTVSGLGINLLEVANLHPLVLMAGSPPPGESPESDGYILEFPNITERVHERLEKETGASGGDLREHPDDIENIELELLKSLGSWAYGPVPVEEVIGMKLNPPIRLEAGRSYRLGVFFKGFSKLPPQTLFRMWVYTDKGGSVSELIETYTY
jgi:hypothetical protein